MRTHIDPEFTAAGAAGEAEQALRVFEELDDERGEALAWESLAYYHSFRGHHAEARQAIERAVAHAAAAGDEPLEAEGPALIASSLFDGAVPLDEVVSYAEKLLDQRDTKRVNTRRLLALLAHAYAMRGQFDFARKLVAERVAAHEDLGNTFVAATSAAMGYGAVEMFAGDPAAAERHLRQGYRVLEEADETGNLSSVAAFLAEAVCAQGRYEEAERYTRISEETAARDDYASQILWRSARAKAFARKGRLADAQQLAREAVTLAARTDDIVLRGDALMALAEVLRLAECPDKAVPVVEEALRLYEEKGNLVSAGKARSLLDELRV